MPNKCSAVGCKSGYTGVPSSGEISYHKFPHEDQNLLQQWLRRISRDNFIPSRHSVLCSLHFTPADFVCESIDTNIDRRRKRPRTLQRRHLKLGAVPSIFPNLPNYFSSPPSEPRSERATSTNRLKNENLVIEQENEAFAQSDCVQSLQELLSKLEIENKPSGFVTVAQHGKAHFIMFNDDLPLKVQSSISVDEDLRLTICQNDIILPVKKVSHIISESRTVDRVSQILNLMAFLKSQSADDNPDDYRDKSFECLREYIKQIESSEHDKVPALKFLLEQLELISVSKFRRRYSPETHVLAYILYSTSPACYHILRKSNVLCLPSVNTLKEITRKVDPEKGIETSHYLNLRKKRLTHFEIYVSLVIDEIYVGQRTEMSSGKVYGMTDSGEVAQTALCFMVKSMSSGYRDVVSIYPVKALNAETLFKCYHETMTLVHCVGFKVVALIVDNASCNRKFYEHHLCGGEMKLKILNEWTDDDLFLIIDPTHNVKNLYNNFQSKKLFVCPSTTHDDGNEFTAKFEDIHDIYDLEMSKPLRIAHKLSLNVLNPKSIERTSMKYAAAIFHESTINGLRHYGKTETAQFLEMVLKAWNIMNVRTPYVGQAKRDPTKEPVKSSHDPKLVFLLEFADFLERWKASKVSLFLYFLLSFNFTSNDYFYFVNIRR